MSDTYYSQNKEKILRQRRNYYQQNKEDINLKNLLYYYDHKDKWKEYHKKVEVLDHLRKRNKHLNRQIEIMNRKVNDKTSDANKLRAKCNFFSIEHNVILIID